MSSQQDVSRVHQSQQWGCSVSGKRCQPSAPPQCWGPRPDHLLFQFNLDFASPKP